MIIWPANANRITPVGSVIAITTPIPAGAVITGAVKIIDGHVGAIVRRDALRLRGGLNFTFVDKHRIAVHGRVIRHERFFERGIRRNGIGIHGTRRMVHIISLVVRGKVRVAAGEGYG